MACCSDGCSVPPPPDADYRRILWIALFLNAGMVVVEVIAAWVSGSVSLQADALDFLGDAANYALGLAVLGAAAAWRARSAIAKGIVMGAFALWVSGTAVWHLVAGTVPRPEVMSSVGFVALVVNVTVAALLYRHRQGDANRRSVWLCSRNDAVVNVAVIVAGLAVWLTGTLWPDIAVAAVVAALGLSSSWQVVRQGARELHQHEAAIAAE